MGLQAGRTSDEPKENIAYARAQNLHRSPDDAYI